MESNDFYLIEYDRKVETLTKKNELWRLRVTRQEFINKVEELRIYEVEAKERKYLNDYHIESNIKGSISIMLMDTPTIEEAMEQAERLRKEAEKYFAEEAPEIREIVRKFELPLDKRKKRFIYSSIFRNQITIDDLQTSIKEEFIKTDTYELLTKRMKK
jgi:ribonucleotide reductase alpha subunit